MEVTVAEKRAFDVLNAAAREADGEGVEGRRAGEVDDPEALAADAPGGELRLPLPRRGREKRGAAFGRCQDGSGSVSEAGGRGSRPSRAAPHDRDVQTAPGQGCVWARREIEEAGPGHRRGRQKVMPDLRVPNMLDETRLINCPKNKPRGLLAHPLLELSFSLGKASFCKVHGCTSRADQGGTIYHIVRRTGADRRLDTLFANL